MAYCSSHFKLQFSSNPIYSLQNYFARFLFAQSLIWALRGERWHTDACCKLTISQGTTQQTALSTHRHITFALPIKTETYMPSIFFLLFWFFFCFFWSETFVEMDTGSCTNWKSLRNDNTISKYLSTTRKLGLFSRDF